MARSEYAKLTNFRSLPAQIKEVRACRATISRTNVAGVVAAYPDDRGKDLDAVLSGIVGRRLTSAETHEALGVSYTTYRDQRDSGRLISCDNLVTIARNLGINEVELLIRYRLIRPDAFEQYACAMLRPDDDDDACPLPLQTDRRRKKRTFHDPSASSL
jgi:hypothetical protein